jgi:hypothetical protein
MKNMEKLIQKNIVPDGEVRGNIVFGTQHRPRGADM